MAYKIQAIEYGRFKNSEWKTLNGLESVESTIQRCKQEIDWTGYQLWAHGAILNGTDTWDIDMTVMGPMDPKRIRVILESLVRIGFEEKTLIDVKYSVSNELYDPNTDTSKEILYACYRGRITIDGTTFEYSKLVNGLYLKSTKYPMNKTKGKSYKSPHQII